MTLKSLIAELEAAKGGSRELSDRVLLAVGWLGQSASSKVAGILVPHWKSPDGRDVLVDLRPCPTTSLDAALTLVNTGGMIRVAFDMPNNFATVYFKAGGIAGDGKAPTPALALCIASLRARDAA